MPVHDWTRVNAGTFHDFHSAWITHIKETLNGGLLPKGYYALAEQHAGLGIADILTLQTDDQATLTPKEAGPVAVAEAPLRVGRKIVAGPNATYRTTRRTLAIRHVNDHRIVALLEILSPANKDRSSSVDDFVDKVHSALRQDCHLLVVDLFPPGPYDPHGIHGSTWETLVVPEYCGASLRIMSGAMPTALRGHGWAVKTCPRKAVGMAPTTPSGAAPHCSGTTQTFDSEDYVQSADKPLLLVAYVASSIPEAYLEPIAVGDVLPDMPLFLQSRCHISVPLESTYQAAYRGMPVYWRGVVEGARSQQ